MQRVMIIGIAGAGKSTLSRKLNARLGLPVYHLDNIYHLPGWRARADADVQRDFEAIATEERWVVDGNYRRLSTALQERADVIIYLHFGRFFALSQVVKRWALHRLGIKRRADLSEGFNEQLPLSFITWIWRWHADNGVRWQEHLTQYQGKLKVFSSRKAANAWLDTL